MASEDRQHLRIETIPIGYPFLTESQREACQRAEDLLVAALEDLATQDRKGADSFKTVGLDPGRASRLLFLSGDRGAGKTSVLLTLRAAAAGVELHGKKGPKSWLSGLRNARDRLIWLETLDLEPLPGPTNLLAALLCRLVDSLQRRIGCKDHAQDEKAPRRNLLVGEPEEFERSLVELERLEADVAVAWDSHVDRRAAALDADNYAAELMRTERARLRLNARLSQCLGAISRHLGQRSCAEPPLFVLPVDDFDLNPTRCLELLRLIRSISVPYLFTIMLGDMAVVSNVFDLKLTADFLQPGARTSDGVVSSVPREVLLEMTGGLTSHAIRKLIPPGQIVPLALPQFDEATDWAPLLHPDQRSGIKLKDLLDRCPVFTETAAASLKQFLCVTAPGTGEPKRWTDLDYAGALLLRQPSRHLTDIWYALSGHCHHSEATVGNTALRWNEAERPVRAACMQELIDWLEGQTRQILRSARGLDRGTREKLLQALADGTSQLRWNDLGLAYSPVIDDVHTVAPPSKDDAAFLVRRVSEGRLSTKPKSLQTDSFDGKRTRTVVDLGRLREELLDMSIVQRESTLTTEATPWLVALHDLHVLSEGLRPRGHTSSRIPVQDYPLVYTAWSLGDHEWTVVPWPVPGWSTLRQWELFWATHRVLSVPDEAATDPLVIAGAWFAATLVTLGLDSIATDPRRHRPAPAPAGGPDFWNAILAFVGHEVDRLEGGVSHREHVEWTLTQLGVVLAPEFGVPRGVCEVLLGDPTPSKFAEFLKEGRRPASLRYLRHQATALIQGLQRSPKRLLEFGARVEDDEKVDADRLPSDHPYKKLLAQGLEHPFNARLGPDVRFFAKVSVKFPTGETAAK